MSETPQTAEKDQRAHHPDCPVNHWPDMPQRCRCMFMAMLDRRANPTAKTSAAKETP